MEASLRERIHSDLLAAMRAKDERLVSVLRMIIAAFEKKQIENRSAGRSEEFTLAEEEALLRAEIKRRREASAIFVSGGRKDLAEKEDAEVSILSKYVPPEASQAEIESAAKAAVAATGAKTQKDMGLAMKEAMKILGGRADGSAVSAEIRKILSA